MNKNVIPIQIRLKYNIVIIITKFVIDVMEANT